LLLWGSRRDPEGIIRPQRKEGKNGEKKRKEKGPEGSKRKKKALTEDKVSSIGKRRPMRNRRGGRGQGEEDPKVGRERNAVTLIKELLWKALN